MIEVKSTSDLPYQVVCCGCGKKIDNNGIRIEVGNSELQKGTIIYCSECWKDYYLPLPGMPE